MAKKDKPNRPVTLAERERLTILIEECAEVQKEATKILRHGWLGMAVIRDVETFFNNRRALTCELGDLSWVIDWFINKGDIKAGDVITARRAKNKSVAGYLHHNTVEP